MSGKLDAARRSFGEFRQTIVWRLLAGQRKWLIWIGVTAMCAFGGAAGPASTFRDLVDEGAIDRSKLIDQFFGLLITLAIWTFNVRRRVSPGCCADRLSPRV